MIHSSLSLSKACMIFTVLKHEARLETICADCRFYTRKVCTEEHDFISVSAIAGITDVTVRGGEVGLWCFEAGCLEHDSLFFIKLVYLFLDHFFLPSVWGGRQFPLPHLSILRGKFYSHPQVQDTH